MTGAGFSAATAVLAALVAGVVAMIGFVLVDDSARGPFAVAVVATGVGVYLGLRGRLGSVARGIGSGLVVLGAQLLGASLLLDLSRADGVLIALLGYGMPALAMTLFAALGMRVWAAGAGIVVPSVVVLVLASLGSFPELTMVVLAVLLTARVVVMPVGTRWSGFVSAAAATCALYASGSGLLPFVLLGWVPTSDLGSFGVTADSVRVLCSVGSVLVAGVLLMLSAVRRELATGLVAAAVLVLADGPGHPFVWLPLAAFVLALVGLRVPAVRTAIARIPVALRGRGEALTAAGCAVVAGASLVAFAWHGLPTFAVARSVTGVSVLVALLVAGALAHFLPTRAGAALAVVTLVVLLLARPWGLLFGTDSRVGGAAGFAVALAASWVLTRRHDTPAVWAAAAYLMLGTLPDVIAPLLGLDVTADPTGHAVTLLLPLVLVGVPAVVLAWWRPRWQAVAAVVVGATIAIPAYVTLSAATGGSLGLPVNPFVPTDTWTSTAFLDDAGTAAVFVTIVVLALGSVVSVARRPAAPVAVTAALVVYATTPAAAVLMDRTTANVELFLLALVVAVVALVMAAWFAARRHVSDAGLVPGA